MGLFAIAGVMSPQDRALGPDVRDLPLSRWLDALAGTSDLASGKFFKTQPLTAFAVSLGASTRAKLIFYTLLPSIWAVLALLFEVFSTGAQIFFGAYFKCAFSGENRPRQDAGSGEYWSR